MVALTWNQNYQVLSSGPYPEHGYLRQITNQIYKHYKFILKMFKNMKINEEQVQFYALFFAEQQIVYWNMKILQPAGVCWQLQKLSTTIYCIDLFYSQKIFNLFIILRKRSIRKVNFSQNKTRQLFSFFVVFGCMKIHLHIYTHTEKMGLEMSRLRKNWIVVQLFCFIWLRTYIHTRTDSRGDQKCVEQQSQQIGCILCPFILCPKCINQFYKRNQLLGNFEKSLHQEIVLFFMQFAEIFKFQKRFLNYVQINMELHQATNNLIGNWYRLF
eukprot:TRINITY_DN1063_c0_g1_i1.p1 TRINITY_DN1063_c0_g1~~TRINITY_DN1063_c0_g1_i1.p1  ORF type:complete len:271 (-),score=-19.70 TRINITY_DN1063_c0_g1_i1:249-1061(-)